MTPPALCDITAQVTHCINTVHHGDLLLWHGAVQALPHVKTAAVQFSDTIRIGSDDECSPIVRHKIEENLLRLSPWRKGPFRIFGLDVDAEWRSHMKWQRIKSALSLRDKRILDVGCGNGYYMWRMIEAGAQSVLGIEPSWLYWMQYQALSAFFAHPPDCMVLPLRLEEFPSGITEFDTIFSMGVIYHRRDPLTHLMQLRDLLRPGGTLILETIVLRSEAQEIYWPHTQRVAGMANVHCLPSTNALKAWLNYCGYRDIRLIDMSETTSMEQRGTKWMTGHSLQEFMAPAPAGSLHPMRAILNAVRGD